MGLPYGMSLRGLIILTEHALKKGKAYSLEYSPNVFADGRSMKTMWPTIPRYSFGNDWSTSVPSTMLAIRINPGSFACGYYDAYFAL